MKRLFYSLFIALMTLSIAIPPPAYAHTVRVNTSKSLSQKVQEIEEFMQFKRILTVDQIFDFIDCLEDDEQTEMLTEQELDVVMRFVSFLARNGVLPNDQCDEYFLENDIDELLNGNNSSIQKTSLSLYENGAVIVCKKEKKNWFSKQWKQTKKFVKKHKKEIIIGTVVVAAAAVVVVGVVVASSATVAAAGSAGGAVANHLQKEEPSSETEEPVISPDSSEVNALSETPLLKEMIQEQNETLKESISQNLPLEAPEDPSFGENIKEFGAHLAHETFDAATDLVSIVPNFLEEVKEVGEQILPNTASADFLEEASPQEKHDAFVRNGHEKIDQVFSTNQADLYTGSGSDELIKKFIDDEFSLGILPPPGRLPKAFSNTNQLVETGKVLDRANFTKAGRSLMKHGYREDSFFPKPVGNPAQINRQGEIILREILEDPSRVIIQNSKEGIEIYAQDGRGAYFRKDGTFRGFIEYGKK